MQDYAAFYDASYRILDAPEVGSIFKPCFVVDLCREPMLTSSLLMLGTGCGPRWLSSTDSDFGECLKDLTNE